MDYDEIKIPVDLDVDDTKILKKISGIVNTVAKSTKAISQDLQNSLSKAAFVLHQMGYKNKGDIQAKFMSLIPSSVKVSRQAKSVLSAAAGQGRGAAVNLQNNEKALARELARAEKQAEKERERQEKIEAKQIQKALGVDNVTAIDIRDNPELLKDPKYVQQSTYFKARTSAEMKKDFEDAIALEKQKQKEKEQELKRQQKEQERLERQKQKEQERLEKEELKRQEKEKEENRLATNAFYMRAAYNTEVQDKENLLEKQYKTLTEYRKSASAPKWINNLLKDIKSINKLTKGGTEKTKLIESYLKSMQGGKSTGGALGKLPIGKYVSWAALLSAIKSVSKWLWNSGQRGLAEGYDVLSEKAKYGPNRATGLTKMISRLFNIDENTAASIDRYSRDFRQRVMWNQVGDNEWIGLHRMGNAGRMIMSGEAANDPRAFLTQFRSWMQNTDTDVIRSVLRQMGWSEEFMKLKLNPYSDEEFNDLADRFEELTDKEAKAAADALRFQNDIKTIQKDIDANVAELTAKLIKDPVGAVRILRQTGLSDEEIEARYPGLIRDATTAEAKRNRLTGLASGNVKPKSVSDYMYANTVAALNTGTKASSLLNKLQNLDPISRFFSQSGSTNNTTNNTTNNITVISSDPKESGRQVVNALKQEQVENSRNSIGG